MKPWAIIIIMLLCAGNYFIRYYLVQKKGTGNYYETVRHRHTSYNNFLRSHLDNFLLGSLCFIVAVALAIIQILPKHI